MILEGDCLDKLKELEDNSVDSIVTDPPYGLVFMGKKWDKSVPVTEVWKECLRVLKPGGYLLSFGGTRTYHKMAVAIEEAGFEIRDMVNWVYSTGFPKSHNIGKAVDKLQGNEREVTGTEQVDIGIRSGSMHAGRSVNVVERKKTKDTSEWEGWGTALKPAHEPICMARKPLSEKTVAKNVLKWGTGGINIDESRVGACREKAQKQTVSNSLTQVPSRDESKLKKYPKDLGRFPANLCHDNSDEVRECLPNKSERFFKSIIYQAKASKKERNNFDGLVSIVIEYDIWNEKNTTKKASKVQLLVATDKSIQKVTGVYGADNKHATEWNTVLFGSCTMEKFQEVNKFITKTETNSITKSQILNWLTHCITKEYTADVKYETENGGNPVENAESSNTLTTTINEKMASALGVNNVVSGARLKISAKDATNFHNTVKPIALMEYLIKMVTKKGGTVLDPFAGSGTTLVAAKKLGYAYIGIEIESEYVKIIEARLKAH